MHPYTAGMRFLLGPHRNPQNTVTVILATLLPAGPPPQSYDPYGPPPVPREGYPGEEHHHHHHQSHHREGYDAGGAYGNFAAPTYHPRPPPNEHQHYGPRFLGPDQNEMQPYFKYSQCNGRKKALCIGINYLGQDGELNGCINDAHNIRNFLCTHFGYREEDVVMLTDDSQHHRQIPTRENILYAMRWLVKDAQPDDSLFFHYSGHGGQTEDKDGDEIDGYDEVIYPVDYQESGHLVDDLMHETMVKPLPAGLSTHRYLRFMPFWFCSRSSLYGKIKEPNLAAEAGQGLLSAVSAYVRGDERGAFESAIGVFKSFMGNGQAEEANQYAQQTRTSPADVISWSGCKDSQTSADTQEAGRATGAMSYAFTTVLAQNPEQSYEQLLNSIRDVLRSKYSQKPQLSSSHPMDIDIKFIC
ncbi:caspase domain-containing protein [Armillaria mellea]|nr:caspase domain-containing protein [Armillaria mellea]